MRYPQRSWCDRLHLGRRQRERCRGDGRLRRALVRAAVEAGALPAEAMTPAAWWRPVQLALAVVDLVREWRRLGRLFVSAEEHERRAVACLACPFYQPQRDRCGHCACTAGVLGAAKLPWWIRLWRFLVKGKLWWVSEKCPAQPPRW